MCVRVYPLDAGHACHAFEERMQMLVTDRAADHTYTHTRFSRRRKGKQGKSDPSMHIRTVLVRVRERSIKQTVVAVSGSLVDRKGKQTA